MRVLDAFHEGLEILKKTINEEFPAIFLDVADSLEICLTKSSRVFSAKQSMKGPYRVAYVTHRRSGQVFGGRASCSHDP